MLATQLQYGLLLLCLCTLSNAGEVVQIVLHKSAEVSTREFSLGDISHIETGDKKLKRDLEESIIGRSPPVGYTGKYRIALIKSRIQSLFPHLGSGIGWDGSDVVAVKALGVSLKKEQYVEAAERHLRQHLAKKSDRIQVGIHGSYRDINLPKGDLKIVCHINNQGSIKRTMPVWVDLYVENQKILSIPVWFRVEAYGPAWRSNNDLDVGSVVREEMFTNEVVDLAAANGDAIREVPKCCVMRTKKRIRSGDILVSRHLEPMPAVVKGGPVNVIATMQGVYVSAEAIALQDGNIGDRIMVRQGQEKTEYEALVIESNTLTVDGVRQ